MLSIFFDAIARKRKLQFAMLIVLNVISSGIDLISIGAVGPFMLALTSPDIPFGYMETLKLSKYFDINEPKDIVLPITVVFVSLIFLSGAIRGATLFCGIRFSFSLGAEISSACYRAYLNKSYLEIIESHTSEIINNIFSNINLVIYQVINPITILASGLSLIILLLVSMLLINPLNALIAITSLATFYVAIYCLIKGKVKNNGKRIDVESSRTIKVLQDGIGGVRDIIVDGTQKTFLEFHANVDSSLRRVQGSNQFICAFPRIGVEVVAMIVISIAGYGMAKNAGIALALPALAMIVMAGQRLLPALQQCYVSINSINSSITALNKINDLLTSDKRVYQDSVNHINFDKSINLKNVELVIGKNHTLALTKINLEILKGERIGFIGKTGSGKSTLVDIIMGLLTPTGGILEVDSVELNPENAHAWRSKVAHVPQSIFLTDDSIKRNIAFGIPEEKIDRAKILSVLDRAQLAELVDALPDGIDSTIGERGAFLSGGQRQRIGIARALYKNSKIIIFDEATSALDVETEEAVMDSIYNLDSSLTILVIAHRLSTLRRCDRIIEMESGGIKRIGTYEELIGENE